jgi:hypothetical protein
MDMPLQGTAEVERGLEARFLACVIVDEEHYGLHGNSLTARSRLGRRPLPGDWELYVSL